jgi:hypothetical protein
VIVTNIGWWQSYGETSSDQYRVVAKVMERLAVKKQRSRRFHMERFNLKTLNEVEGKEKYRVEVSSRFAAFGCYRKMKTCKYTRL